MEKENFLSIDIIRDDVNYWLIRTNGGDWYQDFKQNNHVSITNSIVSLCDLKEVNDIEKYKKIVTSKNQKKQKDLENSLTNLPEDEKQKILDKNNLSKRSITDLSKRLFDFIHKINIGDYVIIPNYRSFEFCIGIIISDATEYTDKNIHSLKINSQKNNYNTAVKNANGVINATNKPNMDANAINGMANQVNTTKAALNGAQNLAQAKTNATNTINNA
ncbi:hypothetical protein C7R27_14350, partial [Staphylococcus aureus]|uniref:FIVAR domain-containing protein n=1 Tax=Staphylococcus aureus TaxID=1280 RepID=UPI000DB32D64